MLSALDDDLGICQTCSKELTESTEPEEIPVAQRNFAAVSTREASLDDPVLQLFESSVLEHRVDDQHKCRSETLPESKRTFLADDFLHGLDEAELLDHRRGGRAGSGLRVGFGVGGANADGLARVDDPNRVGGNGGCGTGNETCKDGFEGGQGSTVGDGSSGRGSSSSGNFGFGLEDGLSALFEEEVVDAVKAKRMISSTEIRARSSVLLHSTFGAITIRSHAGTYKLVTPIPIKLELRPAYRPATPSCCKILSAALTIGSSGFLLDCTAARVEIPTRG